MNKTTISVVMPAYNCGSTVSKSIASVLNQSYRDLELIIINDGSTDNTGMVCDNYALKDMRVKVIHQKNAGPSEARNTGLNNIIGKYVMFIDADDTYSEDILNKMINKMIENKVQLVMCGMHKIYKNNNTSENVVFDSALWLSRKEILKNIKPLLNSGLFNNPVNKLYEERIIREKNIKFHSYLDMGEDFLFNLEYINHCDSMCILNKAMYNYYIESNGLTNKYRENIFEMRKKNIITLREFLENNSLEDDITDYLFIKLVYACFMQIFHQDNRKSLSQNITYIKEILNKPEILLTIQQIRKKGKLESILVNFIKLDSPILLYAMSYCMSKVKKNITTNSNRLSV